MPTHHCSRVNLYTAVALLLSFSTAVRADWMQAGPAHVPTGRSMHAMAMDDAQGQLVLFGGATSGPVAETWLWNGSDWTQVTPPHSPTPRLGHAMAYFASRHEVVLFGGQDVGVNELGDTWVWNGTDWTQLQLAPSPPPRHFSSIAYDSKRDKVVLFGGRNSAGALNDTWEFDGTSWSLISMDGAPSTRFSHSMAYDPQTSKVTLFGGTDMTHAILGDTWEYDGSQWVQADPPVSPPARYGAAMAYDPTRGFVQLFGGHGVSKPLDDLWEWDGQNWAQRPAVTTPPSRESHALALDVNGRLVLFGGSGGRADTWLLGSADAAAQIIVGRGAGGGGLIDTFGGLLVNAQPIDWVQNPWGNYNEGNGEVRVACGHLADDLWDKLVIGFGAYPSNGGWLLVLDNAPHGHRVLAWIHVPWSAYDQADGEVFPACGDVDGDGRDDIVVGFGSFPRAGGYLAVFGDAAQGYAFRQWLHVPWRAYNAANGATHPAVGDLDGDGKQEVVVGLGTYTAGGGWAIVFGDSAASYAAQQWLRMDWSTYNQANGALWPACGDVEGRGKADVVLGCGSAPGASGWARVLGDSTEGFAPLAWLGVRWRDYVLANGEVRPAVGRLSSSWSGDVVLGLGPYPAQGGRFAMYTGFTGGWRHLGWGQIKQGEYTAANGETWPAIGKLR